MGCSREELALPSGNATVSSIVDSLRSRGARWTQAFAAGRTWRVAVNQNMADLATPVKPGDEIAFFPPVTGG